MSEIIKKDDIPQVIKILHNNNETQTKIFMENADFSQLGELITSIAEIYRDKIKNVIGISDQRIPGLEERERLVNILSDLFNLPIEKGDACPSDSKISKLNETITEASETFVNIADKLFENIQNDGAKSVSDFYNQFASYNEKNAEIIKEYIESNEELMNQLTQIKEILVHDIDEGTDEIAHEAIFDLLTGKPNKNINSKTEALILIQELKNCLTKSFIEKIKNTVINDKLRLIENDKLLEDTEDFESSILVSSNFEDLNRQAYLDMLRNPLGQAQTADQGKAESFFRSKESINSKGIQNNFGYVYLTKEQANTLDIESETNKVFDFTYFDQAYIAIPIGLYFSKKNPEKYSETIEGLKKLAENNKDTPIEDYYNSLINYYDFCNTGKDLMNEDFIEGYYKECYKSEQAWVDYIRFAAEKKLPYIHIHPFENYGTPSTKTHDLSLALVNHEETSKYLNAGENFINNARSFFEKSGLTEKYPKMIETTMKKIESATFLSLGARIHSGMSGTIAQNIPNEEEGRKNGIVTLFDTSYAKAVLESAYSDLLKKFDPIGDISGNYENDIKNNDLFMLHYIIEILAHELNHNSFKGKEQNFAGDGKGLPVKAIEEAKATNGLALNFKDPYNLDKTEMSNLKSVIHLMLPWAIFRMRAPYRAQHSSNQYFREGAVMLDHLLKSCVLEIVGVKLDKDGKHNYLEGDNFDLADFEFIRINKSDKTLQDFVSRCADCTKKIGEIYNQSQGFNGELEKDTIIPDVIDYDFYQIISRLCHEEEISKKVKKNENADSTKQSMEKLFDPENDLLKSQAQAIIRLVDNEELGLLIDRVKTMYDLNDKNDIDKKVKEIQDLIKSKYPQIYEE
jgi:hypothetical protein